MPITSQQIRRSTHSGMGWNGVEWNGTERKGKTPEHTADGYVEQSSYLRFAVEMRHNEPLLSESWFFTPCKSQRTVQSTVYTTCSSPLDRLLCAYLLSMHTAATYICKPCIHTNLIRSFCTMSGVDGTGHEGSKLRPNENANGIGTGCNLVINENIKNSLDGDKYE